MSVKLMSQVWGLAVSRERKLVLMALADHADDDGYCFPSAAYVAWKTEYSERQIQRILDELEKENIILVTREYTPTTPRIYKLALENAPKKADYQRKPSGRGDIWRGDISTGRGDISAPRGDIAVSPEPPLETSIEPSIRESGAKSAPPAEPPKAEKPAKAKADLFPIASALSDVCQMPLEINRGRLFREAKQLCAAGVVPPVTPDEIRARYGAGGWWYREDWRGQKGEPPTPAAIRQTWGQWTVPKIIPFKAGKLTKGQIIKELLNGDGTDSQDDIGVIFGGVSVAPRGNGHAEGIAGRLADGAGGCT